MAGKVTRNPGMVERGEEKKVRAVDFDPIRSTDLL